MTFAAHEFAADTKVPFGRVSTAPLELDLAKLMAGRCLIQGSSGAGKSQTPRRIIEEAFDYLTTIIVDPEGEFASLADHIGATTILARDYANDGLTALALRARQHRIALHLDLTDLEPDIRIEKAAAFFAGLLSAPREHWGNTVLVCIDEAHLLAPHMAASARDAETRRLGVATLTDMCARGRKRGIGTIIATQRLAKLASSVVSELHNHLIGLNVFDRDVARVADLLMKGGADETTAVMMASQIEIVVVRNRQLAPLWSILMAQLSDCPDVARREPRALLHTMCILLLRFLQHRANLGTTTYPSGAYVSGGIETCRPIPPCIAFMRSFRSMRRP
ncbi:type IV secretory system conjugative DNA transfer family protein [Novosphingobium sp. SG707]|uniref:type IV secretory system conjugative DNA transfer family protein n=1 Tax=Novosphingobium sp. SG707 TaxID=2586996 RepID=UPI001FF0D4F5|nr:type IV secretory system conjugative DNA transfer family protein [Novosphingobium sp. SG707]